MKSVTINNELLKKALNRLKGIVGKNTVVPVLEQIIFKVTAAGVTITGSDLEVTLVVSVPTESLSLDEFEILMPFDLLHRISALTGAMPCTISTDEEKAIIECGQDKYALTTLEPLSQYPKLPAVPVENSIKLGDGFAAWLNRSLATVSSDTLRPAMCHILLEMKGGVVTVVTTDAHTMFVKSMETSKSIGDGQLLISPKVARALHGFDETEIFWSDQQLAFKAEGLSVFATRHEDKYPNWRAVMPQTEANVEFNRGDLIYALEKAALTAGFDRRIKFNLKDLIGAIRLSSNDADRNRNGHIDIAGDYTGSCPVISVDSERIIRSLNQVPFATIALAITDQARAMLIKSSEDENYTGLVMPLMTT